MVRPGRTIKCDALTINADRARIRLDDAGEDRAKGRLAGAIVPDQRHDLAWVQSKPDVVKRRHGTIMLGDSLRDQDWPGRSHTGKFSGRYIQPYFRWIGHLSDSDLPRCYTSEPTVPGLRISHSTASGGPPCQ